MLEDFDKHVSILSESLARMLSRRKMVGSTIKGVFATVAAATAGQLTNVGEAFASHHCTCDDNWTVGKPCANLGHTCPHHSGCPQGCVVCHSNDCGGWCNWSTGKWVSCHGLGTCGKGYKICTDCKCLHCSHKCTCLSQCICCSCCTSADVRNEMERLAAVGA